MIDKDTIRKYREKLELSTRPTENIPGTPSQRIARTMRVHGLSAVQVAEALNQPVETILKVISEEKTPDYDVLCGFALLTNVPMLWLVTNQTPRESWPETTDMSFGKRIDMLLRYYDVRYRMLSKAIDIGISAISSWVNEASLPRLSDDDDGIVDRLCHFFAVDKTWLLTGHNPKTGYNHELLTAILENIDSVCSERGINPRDITPENRARLINLLYRFFQSKENGIEQARNNKVFTEDLLMMMDTSRKKKFSMAELAALA